MSLFGYPATVKHFHSGLDEWGRPLPPTATEKSAKVDEEQKLIKNAKGEEITIAYTISLEGTHSVGFDDYFEYVNAFGDTIRIDVAHYEIRKYLGADEVKEVVVYG